MKQRMKTNLNNPNEHRTIIGLTPVLAICVALAAGCATTKSTLETESSMLYSKPEHVLVYDFAVSPEEVELDSGLGAKLENAMKKTPRTEQEKEIGRQVANVLAVKLVAEIQSLGLPANRATGAPPEKGSLFAIKGQFVSIDEGNRTERTMIGLGLGRTDVATTIQGYDFQNGKKSLAISFETDAKSGRKPGLAESMGVGAVGGHLAVATAIGVGGDVASEALSANVDADAERTAKKIASQLKDYFAGQGWITQY
jgi:hypothetical protein